MRFLRHAAIQLVLLAAMRSAVCAQDHEIVFLLDQSGSMQRSHGPNNAWGANDPLHNRLETVMQGYETLQKHLENNRLTNVRYRLHVIEFGDMPRRRSDLTTSIAFDPAAARSQQEKQKLRLGLVARDMGQTHTLSALTEALATVTGFTGVPRERVHVLLVTDGKPAVPSVATEIGSQYQQSMDATIQQLNRVATLDVIGVVGREDRDPYWPQWGPYWNKVTNNHAVAGRDGTEISINVDRILRDRVGLPAPVSVRNPYFCPPYLRSITFTVFKRQRGGHAWIQDALGRVIAPGMPGVAVTSEVTYDRITIDTPAPGLWELDQRAANIFVDPLYQQVVRAEPKAALNAHMPVTFQYQVLSPAGDAFRELPDYPVQVSLQVAEPAGARTDLPMRHAGSGVFTATSSHEFDKDGQARLRLVGTTMLPNNERHTVFTTDDPLVITNKRLLVLAAGSSLPGLMATTAGRGGVSPSIVIVQHPGGARVALPTVSTKPSELLKFRIVDVDGTSLTPWAPLMLDGETFHGLEQVRTPLLSPDWLFRRPRPAFVEMSVDDKALDQGSVVRGLTRDAPEPEVDRASVSPALLNSTLAVPVIFREGLASYLGILFGLALIACGATYVGYRYLRKLGYFVTDHWVLGQQVFVAFQRPFAGEGEEFKKRLTGDYLHRYAGRHVAITLGEGDDLWKPQWLRIKRLFRPWQGPTIRIEYPVHDKSGTELRRQSMTLGETPIPTNLDGVGKVQVQLRVRRRGAGAPTAVRI